MQCLANWLMLFKNRLFNIILSKEEEFVKNNVLI